jgi:hypothetical protein
MATAVYMLVSSYLHNTTVAYHTTTLYRDQVLAEIDSLPDEYLPFVLQLVHTLRESVMLKPAAASLRQGWAKHNRI